MGHDGPPQGLWTENLVTKQPLERCPVRTLLLAPPALTAEVHRYVNTWYPAYQDGFLMQEGGLADQPARYVELVQLTQRLDRMVQARWDELRPQDGDE